MSLRETTLSADEKERILAICGDRALLVGGQSLAFWAAYFNVAPLGVLATAITTDIDFLGSADVARDLRAELGRPWQLRTAGADDIGAQTAKVFARVGNDGLKQVDFLSSVVGLDTARIRARAVEFEFAEGRRLQVLHPLDVLESRLINLAVLPGKRDEFGVEQARLAIQVVRAFVLSLLQSRSAPRVVFQAVQNLRRLALDRRLATVAFDYDLDVLEAIPADQILAPKFSEMMWPRLVASVRRKRASYDARVANRRKRGRRSEP